MAAPNLRNPNIVTGKTAAQLLTTSLSLVLGNSAASGKVLKINTIRVANIHATSSSGLDLTLFRNNSQFYLTFNNQITAGQTLIVTDKNEYLYLEEGDQIHASSSIVNSLVISISYEEIS